MAIIRVCTGALVPDLQSGGCRFESQPGLLRTKVYSAFHLSRVGKWVPAIAGKAKADMAHSNCEWTSEYTGKTEIPWEHVPYPSAFAVAIHCEEALYQVYDAYLYLLESRSCIRQWWCRLNHKFHQSAFSSWSSSPAPRPAGKTRWSVVGYWAPVRRPRCCVGLHMK